MFCSTLFFSFFPRPVFEDRFIPVSEQTCCNIEKGKDQNQSEEKAPDNCPRE
jgi:hypothetical protein